jgi:ABC-type transporter Mla MlaB component
MATPEVLRMPAQVTLQTAPAVLEAAAAALAAGGREIDLADCSDFDSSLIAVLLELSRRAGAGAAAPLGLRNVPPNLRKLAALYGVDELLFERN